MGREDHLAGIQSCVARAFRDCQPLHSFTERQCDNVDPEKRLIASTLETRWERALEELEQSKARLAELRAQSSQPVPIPAELREAFADAGRRLRAVGAAPDRGEIDDAARVGSGRQSEPRWKRSPLDQDRVAWRPCQ